MKRRKRKTRSIAQEDFARLFKAIALLSRRDFRAVRMRFFEDCTVAEVAQALGTSEPKAEALLESALLKMKSAFEKNFPHDASSELFPVRMQMIQLEG